jgi:vacuolar-type H+-ATPase subunit I/STV1
MSNLYVISAENFNLKLSTFGFDDKIRAKSPLDALEKLLLGHPLKNNFKPNFEYHIKVAGPSSETFIFLNGEILELNYKEKFINEEAERIKALNEEAERIKALNEEAERIKVLSCQVSSVLPLKVVDSLNLVESHYNEIELEVTEFERTLRKLVNHRLFDVALEEFFESNKHVFSLKIKELIKKSLGIKFSDSDLMKSKAEKYINEATLVCLDLFQKIILENLIKEGLIKDNSAFKNCSSELQIRKTVKWTE